MRWVRIWWLIVSLLGVAVAGGACDKRAADPLPPPVTTTSTTAVSYDVPAVIDEAYVGRVMKALDHVYGDAVRHLAETRVVDESFLKYLVAIYTDRYFKLAQDAWVKDVASGLQGLPPVPQDAVTSLQELRRKTKDCVFVAVARDYSGTRSNPSADPHQHYVALIPKPANRDPQGLNPTPWIMTFDGFTQSGAEPEDPCRAA
jgi:hypothetical protein